MQKKIHFSFILSLISFIFLAGCNESTDSSNPIPDENEKSTVQIDPFVSVLYSSYIRWNPTEDQLLIKFDFFPEGTDFQFAQKKVVLPCNFLIEAVSDEVNYNLNAEKKPECIQKSIEFDEKDEFTLDGIVVALGDDGYYKGFVEFGIEISSDGIYSTDHHVILDNPSGLFFDFVNQASEASSDR